MRREARRFRRTFAQCYPAIRTLIPQEALERALEKDDDGKLQLFIRGRDDVLPVSSAFQHRFRGM